MDTGDEIELARRVLALHFGGAAAAEIVPLARFNNPVFRLLLPGGERILKISKSMDGAATRKEALLIERLGRQGIPVAEVEFADAEGRIVGRPYFIMRSAGDRTVAELIGPGDVASQLLFEMGAILARVHALPPGVFSDVPADRISAAGVASYLESLAAAAEVLAEQRLLEREEIARFQALVMPSAVGESLCHSDYHAVQCIVKDDRVAAVADWESAWIGNPLIDLAISHAYLDYYCPALLTKRFMAGYLSVRAIPASYPNEYLPVRLVQVLGMMRAWYTRGRAAWRAAIEQQKVARAVRLFRLYAAQLGK